jgi:hypothetical protein
MDPSGAASVLTLILSLNLVQRMGDSQVLQNLQERERMAYEDAVIKYDRKGVLDNDALQRGKRLLVQMTSVDGEGKLLFDPADVDAMAGIDSAVINVICDAERVHVGMTKTDMASLVGPAQLRV